MRRRVDAARAAAHDGDADVGELIRELARDFDSVMRRLARADHRHGIFVLRGQRAFDVEHDGRIVNFVAATRDISSSSEITTWQPNSSQRFNSAARSTFFSQLEIDSAVSSPMP